MSKVRVKTAKIPLGADGESVAEMFNAMLGEGKLDLNVAYPKYCALQEYCKNIIIIFTEIADSPLLSQQEFTAERADMRAYISALTDDVSQAFEMKFDGIFDLTTVPDAARDQFSETYRSIKNSEFITKLIQMGHNLADYRDRINAQDVQFIDNIPGVEWRPFPCTGVNLKNIFAYIATSPHRVEIARLFLVAMKSMLENCIKIYRTVSQPDIDIEKFISVLMEALGNLRKLPKLSRCGKAFDKIASSVDLFRQQFSSYYTAFVKTRSSSVILENFVLDVAKKTDADMETMRQFRLIINYYRERAASSGKMNPDVEKLFRVMETNLNKFNEMAGGMADTSDPNDTALPEPEPEPQLTPQQQAEMAARTRAATKSVDELAEMIEGKRKPRGRGKRK